MSASSFHPSEQEPLHSPVFSSTNPRHDVSRSRLSWGTSRPGVSTLPDGGPTPTTASAHSSRTRSFGGRPRESRRGRGSFDGQPFVPWWFYNLMFSWMGPRRGQRQRGRPVPTSTRSHVQRETSFAGPEEPSSSSQGSREIGSSTRRRQRRSPRQLRGSRNRSQSVVLGAQATSNVSTLSPLYYLRVFSLLHSPSVGIVRTALVIVPTLRFRLGIFHRLRQKG